MTHRHLEAIPTTADSVLTFVSSLQPFSTHLVEHVCTREGFLRRLVRSECSVVMLIWCVQLKKGYLIELRHFAITLHQQSHM